MNQQQIIDNLLQKVHQNIRCQIMRDFGIFNELFKNKPIEQ
jgi:hypothetical protein